MPVASVLIHARFREMNSPVGFPANSPVSVIGPSEPSPHTAKRPDSPTATRRPSCSSANVGTNGASISVTEPGGNSRTNALMFANCCSRSSFSRCKSSISS